MSLLLTRGLGIGGGGVADTGLAPTITLVSPANGSAISRDTPIIIDVTDDESVSELFALAGYSFLEAREVALEAGAFSTPYASHSSIEDIDGGVRLTLRRKEIWPTAPTLSVFAWDGAGNYANATFFWALVPDAETAGHTPGATELPRDLLLDSEGDLDISTGDVQLTTGKEAIAQSIDIGLGTIKGEWFADEDEGLDLFGVILVNNPSEPAIQEELRRVVLLSEGVVSVPTISLVLDRPARTLDADIRVISDEGELTKQIRLGAPA